MSAFDEAWDIAKARLAPLTFGMDDFSLYRRPNYIGADGPSDDYFLRLNPELALAILRDSEAYQDSQHGWNREERGPRGIGAKRAVMDLENDPSILANLSNAFSRTSTRGNMGPSNYADWDVIENLLAREGGPVEQFLQSKVDADEGVDVGWLEAGKDGTSKMGKIMAMMRMPGFRRNYDSNENDLMQHILAVALHDKGHLWDETWSPSGAGAMASFGHEAIREPEGEPKSRIRTLGDLIGSTGKGEWKDNREVLSREGFGHSLFQDAARAFKFPKGMVGRSQAIDYGPGRNDLEEAIGMYGADNLFHDADDWETGREADDYDITSTGKLIHHEKPLAFPYNRALGVASIGEPTSVTPYSLKRYDWPKERGGGSHGMFDRLPNLEPRTVIRRG
jgi:hypothetical protein